MATVWQFIILIFYYIAKKLCSQGKQGIFLDAPIPQTAPPSCPRRCCAFPNKRADLVLASPVQGEVVRQSRAGGVVKRNNPPVFAYAETAPFAQGGLFSLGLPFLAKGRWCGRAAPEGLYTAEQSPSLRICGGSPLCTRGPFVNDLRTLLTVNLLVYTA